MCKIKIKKNIWWVMWVIILVVFFVICFKSNFEESRKQINDGNYLIQKIIIEFDSLTDVGFYCKTKTIGYIKVEEGIIIEAGFPYSNFISASFGLIYTKIILDGVYDLILIKDQEIFNKIKIKIDKD